jgi:5-methylthioadenosine/S-adenosylhomocysteine deaminase
MFDFCNFILKLDSCKRMFNKLFVLMYLEMTTTTEDTMSEFIDVGAVYTAPGHCPSLGPTRIEIRSGRIVSLSPLSVEDLQPSTSHLLALPAISNAHDHGRGLPTLSFDAPDETLETWLPTLSYEPRTDPYVLATVAFARMVESGICATNHCHNTLDSERLFNEAEALSRAARDVGIRVAFAVAFVEQNFHVYGNIEKLLALLPYEDHAAIIGWSTKLKAMINETMVVFNRITSLEHDFFRVQFGPVGPQWLCDETLAVIAKLSAESGRRIHMHLLETNWQREWADTQYSQKGMLDHLDKLGLLSPRLTVAHGVHLTEADCKILAERQVIVSVNTSSNLRLRSGVAPVRLFQHANVRFGLGLDGMSFDDDWDMLKELRLFWHLQRGFGGEKVLNEADLFDAACVTGRKTIVDDSGGRLNVGAPADIIILDVRRMMQDRVRPSSPNNMLSLLLSRMSKKDIVKVIIAGRTIVSDGKCVTVDLPALNEQLLAEARANASSMDDNGRIERLRTAVDKFYCCGYHRVQMEM